MESGGLSGNLKTVHLYSPMESGGLSGNLKTVHLHSPMESGALFGNINPLMQRLLSSEYHI